MKRVFSIGRPGFLVGVFVLGFGFTVSTQDDHRRFPPGDGRDVTLRVCSQCHSPDSAADQQLDAAGWQDLVNQMVATGAEMTPQEYDQIIRYLSKAFPPHK